MSAGQIVAIVYGSGVAGGFIVVGATGVSFWNGGDPGPAFLPFFWPLSLPWIIGVAIRKKVERRRIAEVERQKWLNAELPK